MLLWDDRDFMKWQEITVTTQKCAAEAVAYLFYEAGAQGLIIEEDNDEQVALRGYLPEDPLLNFRFEKLKGEVKKLKHFFPEFYALFSTRWIEEEDWASSWKAYYKPTRVTERLVVKPSWDEYSARPGEIIIELDPGMAFGTGTHPTTIMALKFLEEFLKPGFVVYDVGTGSGILAIAAALLGAAEVVAVDSDPVALRVAKENIERNRVKDIVRVEEGDLLHGFTKEADLIVANIVASVLLRLLPQAAGILKPGGYVILGGILALHKAKMLAALENYGFYLIKQDAQGDWVTLAAKKG